MIFFYFLKIIFKIDASKQSKTYKNNLFLAKQIKKIEFFKNTGWPAFRNGILILLETSHQDFFYGINDVIIKILVYLQDFFFFYFHFNIY
jgi:hypothetical protein